MASCFFANIIYETRFFMFLSASASRVQKVNLNMAISSVIFNITRSPARQAFSINESEYPWKAAVCRRLVVSHHKNISHSGCIL